MPYVVRIARNQAEYVGDMGAVRPYLKARIFETKSEAMDHTANPALIEKVDVVTVKYYSDDGHGWYAIKRDIIKDLGILDQISAYSYQRGATVYLEEDSDASKMFTALTEKNMLVNVCVGKNYDGRAPIRSYDRFQK